MSASWNDPPSPALSPRSSPTPSMQVGVNLKTPNGTQAHYESAYPTELPSLDTLQQKYNQVNMRILERSECRALVLKIFSDSGLKGLEIELPRLMNTAVAACREALEDTKRDVFLRGDVSSQLLQLLPDLQQDTFKGRIEFITCALKKLDDSYQSQQISTTTPASPSTSSTPHASNVEVTPEASTGRRSQPQRKTSSSTLQGPQAGRI